MYNLSSLAWLGMTTLSSTTELVGHDDGPPRLQLKVSGPNVNALYDLPEDSSMLIGRGADVDIDLPATAVSRRHARLHLRAGQEPTIEDMGSANKTRVAGLVLRPGERVPLRPGQAIQIWEYVLMLRSPVVGSNARDLLPVSCNSTVQMVMQAAEPGLVLHDERMKTLYRHAREAAAGNVTVLIQGETGSGKDVLARAIHRFSPRAARPFATIDLGALSENLIESELFGHEKGAFTTADRRKSGLLQTAPEGTIFLNEIGELPLRLQVKLLRVIEDRVLIPVGGTKPLRLDVRFIAATNKDLAAEVQAGRFRRDLFFRLRGFALTVPPLRERRGEILVLAQAFAQRFASELGRPTPPLQPDAAAALQAHDWPGNVRELSQVMESAVIRAGTGSIGCAQLPEDLTPRWSESSSDMSAATERVLTPEEEAHRRQIEVVLFQQCAGNQTRAAKILGVSRRTLCNWLRDYRISRPRDSSASWDSPSESDGQE
jgi:two-component system response regulator AtoC